jgi:3-oxoacyl-[acyl-carrier-protein] synthase-3
MALIKARIIGTGSCTPQRILLNEALEAFVDTDDEWILKRTGIKERRIASKNQKESTTDLGTRAALKAIEMAGISPEEIDLIIVGTVTPDMQFPSAACMIQKELGAVNAAAFDLSAGCTGFLYSLAMADNAIRSGSSKTVLVLGAERLSSILNWQDRSTCVLMGDGAGAVVLQAGQAKDGILSTHLKADGQLWEWLYTTNGNNHLPDSLNDVEQKPFQLHMDGNPLFKRAVEFMADIAGEALKHNHLSIEDISFCVPHQANLRIIKAMAKALKFPMERVFTNVRKYGNTSSASVPIALDEANRLGYLKKGDHILLAAFGAGLTWGSSIVKWAI